MRLPSGALLMVASAFFFSVMSLLVKLAGQRLPTLEIAWFRSSLTLVLSIASLRAMGVPSWGQRKGWLLLRGAVGSVGLLCFYESIVRLPLADATVIQYTNPAWTTLFAWIFLGERASWRLAAGLAGCLAGVAVLARPSGLVAGSVDGLAVAIALLGALSSAVAYTLVRFLRTTEDPLVIVLYFPMVATPLLFPLAAAVWVWPTPAEWLILIAIALATQTAQICLTRGLAALPAGEAMNLTYVQVVFATLWGVLLFAERPDGWTAAGALLVIAGALAAGGR